MACRVRMHRVMMQALRTAALALALSTTACVGDIAEPAGDQTGAPEDTSESADAIAGCAKHARIFSYNPVGWEHLTQAFADNPSPCADYYVHLPAGTGDKTTPRGPNAPAEIRAHGPRFHALAEFHYGKWSEVANLSWLDKGKLFRKRMIDQGYDPLRDSWSINELPSTTRTDPQVRQHVRDLVNGLYDGPPGSPPMGGLVWNIGVGTQMVNYAVYKPVLEDWLEDAGFWQDMNAHVRWWGQEVYARPSEVCVGSATAGQRAEQIDEFAFHPAELAFAGPAGAAAARAFFDESYTPTLSAFWHGDSYGTEKLTLVQMKHHVSSQIYAARLWAKTHPYPDWRLSLSWNEQLDGASEADLAGLAQRVAAAVRDAYSNLHDEASRACSPSGAYTWCGCSVSGASFNPGWKTFQSW